jgi:hypothetical protein
MARIKTVSPEEATGDLKGIFDYFKQQYGGVVPGIYKILFADPKVGGPVGDLYQHLHMRELSPMTRLQREMVATVVNGIIGGAP